MSISGKSHLKTTGLLFAGLLVTGGANAGEYGQPYSFGTPATVADIAAFDIDIMADGRGLPPGSGTYAEGEELFADGCAYCHGENLEGGDGKALAEILEPPVRAGPRLIGGRGTLTTEKFVKTVESYWPYSTTLYDFIRRAMPITDPGSLTDDEVYALSAYILGRANIIEQSDVMDADTLWQVQMPNRDGFFDDERPEPVINYD
jgi:mono/diheme cytochrome c family protein